MWRAVLGIVILAVAGAMLAGILLPGSTPIVREQASTPTLARTATTEIFGGTASAMQPESTDPIRPLLYETQTSPAVLYPPPPPVPSPARLKQRFYLVVVESATKIKADDLTIRLAGLDGPAVDEMCPEKDGASWPCGNMAQSALAHLIRTRAIDCMVVGKDDDGAERGRCSVGSIDINDWMVRQGWAKPSDDGSFADALAEAKQDGNGLWRTSAGQ